MHVQVKIPSYSSVLASSDDSLGPLHAMRATVDRGWVSSLATGKMALQQKTIVRNSWHGTPALHAQRYVLYKIYIYIYIEIDR